MGWADDHIKTLRKEGWVEFRPTGRSMEPLIMSGDLVRVEEMEDPETLEVGDIVLCTVGRNSYLQLVKGKTAAMQGWKSVTSFQVGDNKGGVNGWTTQIHGRVVPR